MQQNAELSDEEWDRVECLIPFESPCGRPRKHGDRELLEAIVWKLRSGKVWRDLPDRFPSFETVQRYHRSWRRNGALAEIARELGIELPDSHPTSVNEFGLTGARRDGSKIVLERGPDLWSTIEVEYAGNNLYRWKMLACLHLRVHCGWSLERIGYAYGHPKGHVTRLIDQVKRELRDRFEPESSSTVA